MAKCFDIILFTGSAHFDAFTPDNKIGLDSSCKYPLSLHKSIKFNLKVPDNEKEAKPFIIHALL